MSKLDREQFFELASKLDKITILLAMTVVKGLRSEEQIGILSAAGFHPSEIAPLIGKTPNAVRIALHQLRKRAQK